MTEREQPKAGSATADDPTLPGHGAAGVTAQAAGGPPHDGLEIPGYVILDRLGTGGMGTVYLAEQLRPRRRVALKIVRGGPVADELSLKLFQREADTLARLRHPDIAALYEVGRTSAGQPFLTMELVQGPTLAEWLRGHPGTTGPGGSPSSEERRRRLGMFRNICDAVHYAHQRGVIHRDLKPANLIVPADDTSGSSASVRAESVPRVVILDFGLARMIDTDAPEPADTMLSQAGSIRGTLAYMSPEQALGNRDLIDVRSDVYSLGVLLYEMLTGARPYDLEGLSFIEAIHVVCDQAPRPLARAWSGGGRPDPDLETIVARALSKDPADRYGSAAALGEDVGRYLTLQPILARPPSTMYQIRKLIARRKAPFAAAGAAVILVVLGAVALGALYLRSERNLARALAAEKSANAEAATSRRTAEFLVDLFDGSSPERARGETITAREIMDIGARRIERELAGEPRIQARLMTTIGGVYRKLALYEESLRMIDGGLAVRRRSLPANDPDLGAGLNERGLTLEELGRLPEAEAAYREALSSLAVAVPPDTASLVAALGHLGGFLSDHGKPADGAVLIDSALALQTARGIADDPVVIALMREQALVRLTTADMPGAQALLEEALARSRRVNGELSPMTANLASSLAVSLSRQGKPGEAETWNREVLATREQLYGPGHPLVAQALGNLGVSLAEQGRFAEARPLMERAGAIMESILGPDHPIIATGLTNLGLMNLQMGDADRALPLLDRARVIRERTLGPDDPSLGLTLYHLAGARVARGEYGAARDLLLRVVAIDSKAVGPEHPDVADDLEGLVEVYRLMGDDAAARAAEARMNAIRSRS